MFCVEEACSKRSDTEKRRATLWTPATGYCKLRQKMLLTAAITCNFSYNLQCNVLASYGRNDACRHLVLQRQIVPRVAGKATCLPLFCNFARYIASFNMYFTTCLSMFSPHHCISSCRRKGSCSGTLGAETAIIINNYSTSVRRMSRLAPSWL